MRVERTGREIIECAVNAKDSGLVGSAIVVPAVPAGPDSIFPTDESVCLAKVRPVVARDFHGLVSGFRSSTPSDFIHASARVGQCETSLAEGRRP